MPGRDTARPEGGLPGAACKGRPASRTAAVIAAAALILLGCLAYLSPDGHHPDAWPTAALPAFPGYALAHVLDNAIALTAVGNIDDADGSLELDTPADVAAFESDGATYLAVAAYKDGGVQILNITDPTDPVPVGQIDDADGSLELDGAVRIALFESDGTAYLAVSAARDDGVQILDITDPTDPVPVGQIEDDSPRPNGNHPLYQIDDDDGTMELDGAHSMAIFELDGITYLAVSARYDNGIQILNITDPANPAPVGLIDDTPSLVLDDPRGLAAFKSDGSTYLAVAAAGDDGVLILNITDPANPSPVGEITDTNSLNLGGAFGLALFESDGATYLAVAANNDHGVQILDITDPTDPVPVGQIRDPWGSRDRGNLELGDPIDVVFFESDGTAYLAVSAFGDDGVQILDITDPTDPVPVDRIDDTDSLELDGADGIAVFKSDGATHLAVAAYNDDGVQILRLGPPTNQPPAVAAGPGQTVAEGSTITLDGAASDPDGDPLTYRWTHNSTIPIALGDDASAGTTFAAPRVPSDATIAFTLTATDHHNATASDTTLVTVADDPPVLGAIGNRTIDEGLLLEFAVSATDDDVPAGDLSYAVSGLPEGAAWDPSTRTFGWTPTEAQGPGTYHPSFTVSDGAGGTGSQTVYITVREVNVPPVLGAIGNRTISEGSALSFIVSATDGDVPANDLSYAVSGLPEGAAWDPSTRTFGWTPTEAQGPGTYRPSFTVSDGAGGTGSETVYITVEEVNGPPVADAGADRTASADEEVVLAGAASDPDEDPLTYLWRQTAGSPAVALANHDTLSPSFTAPRVTANATLAFSLTVGDGLHNSTDTVLVAVGVPDDSHFVTTWRTTAPGESITIPVGGASGAYTVDWGDGTISEGVSGDQTHEYGDAGTHTIRVYGGFERIYLGGDTRNAAKLLSIEQWGDIRWASMGHAFSWASNMVYRATDTPDLSGVTDMSYMFSRASSFNGDISSWDVSQVTDMSDMFVGASSFNRPLNEWDVSQVTAMPYMFSSASSFNRPLNDWDVSQVTDMRGMFYQASSFNQPLNDWDVSSATDMFHMFWGASSFNQPLSSWDVSQVTDMSGMFWDASSFNRPLNDWDVSSVTDMSAMFHQASSFNQPLNAWDVSSVADMSAMFRQAASFNQPVSAWDVSSATDMSAMFHQASSFNQPLSPWDVSQVTDMHYMFLGASSFNQPLSLWNVSSVTDMSHMFHQADGFNRNLGGWYIVLDGTAVDPDTGAVGSVSAQNAFLDRQAPIYAVGPGGDSGLFEMDGTTLKLRAAQGNAARDSYMVTVTSAGGFGAGNSRTFAITGTSTGDGQQAAAPVLGDVGPRTIREGSHLEIILGAADPDTPAGQLTYGMSGAPAGAELDPAAGRFGWTPTEAQGPGTYRLNFTVSDGAGGADSETVSITVNEVNAPPTLALPAGVPSYMDEGSEVSFTATATDPDIPENTLTYGLLNEPAGAAITGGGQFSWTPTERQGPGAYAFNITVTDGISADSVRVAITVNEVDDGPQNTSPSNQTVTANRPPVLAEIGDMTAPEGSPLSFTISATDGDGAADVLTYSMSGGPDGAVFGAGGAFSWTPAEAQGPGTYRLNFTVSDGAGGADSEMVTVTVLEVNQNPRFTTNGGETLRCSWNSTESALSWPFELKVADDDLPEQTLQYMGGADVVPGGTIPLTTISGGSFSIPGIPLNATSFDNQLVYDIAVMDELMGDSDQPVVGKDIFFIYVSLPGHPEYSTGSACDTLSPN